MLIKEFIQEAENIYNKYFPLSKCFIRFSKNLYSNITIACFLAGDKKENSNNYWENDMFNIRFSIDTITGQFPNNIDENSIIPNNLVLECNRKSYDIKPESKYLVYDTKKVDFRKVKGDSKKLLQALDKFFKKLYAQLRDDLQAGIIHEHFKELLIKKLQKGESKAWKRLKNYMKSI